MELAPPQRPASHRTERLPNSAFAALLPPSIETNQKPCDNISNLCEGVAIMAARGNGKDRHRRRGREAGHHARKESGIFLLQQHFCWLARRVFGLQKHFCGLPGAFLCFKRAFAACSACFRLSKELLRLAWRVFGFQKNFCGSPGTFSAFKRTFVGSSSAFSGFERAFALCHRGIRRFD